MPDIFDQLANDPSVGVSPTTVAPTGDIFDRIAGTQQEPQFKPQSFPKITEENHHQFAAEYITAVERENSVKFTAGAKIAAVDQFRIQAGLKPLLGRDAYQEALKKRNRENPFWSAQAELQRAVGSAGSSIVGAINANLGRKLQEDLERVTGEGEGVAGKVGGLIGSGFLAAGAIATGGIGAADGELVHGQLVQEYGSGVLQARRSGGVFGGNVLGQDPGAGGGAHLLGSVEVFQGDGDAV